MKNQIIIGVLAGLVIFQFIHAQFFVDNSQIIPEYYREQIEENQRIINDLQSQIPIIDKQINIIHNEIIQMDSLILDADDEQLDSLFTAFFNLTM